ncbi:MULTISPECIES: DUF4229 domain-containing protein [Streptomyces]|uniref:Putative membrane protein n=1 Tax=Streptomyces venezuelae (strain ATCC 10712 / CBS 650.69 / DSM 40230 / JCM 4526 / NBRC 13096 / PD 04745) TaxID=953739 RepID=F2R8U7_STRVP|nr:DUF4229 domain-containing protein [Streptomyces venezuelae]APE22254.1 hypothetical protein vnz_15350 [Streptomyces venezuelae]QER99638.1 DUF4229 domain-containing protein [Streptomyces venezuelae ATCC 10712]QES06656.1 DUF4229 domain-containing protein [Streptomyces venezuelae]QES14600.1 DUF4229 domain-containing protein [Streptomyces venezuelae]CCA56407.1 putative membrane protein [Streptomyces venezuelae ATCC 10712]
MLRYTLMRLGIFAGCFLALWGLVYIEVLPRGLGDSNLLWVLVLAIVISAPLSFVLLRKVRDEASAEVVAKVDRAKDRLAANRSQED